MGLRCKREQAKSWQLPRAEALPDKEENMRNAGLAFVGSMNREAPCFRARGGGLGIHSFDEECWDQESPNQ